MLNSTPELPLFYCVRLLRLEGPTNESQSGWSLDFDKIDKALDFLNIENYVRIRFTTAVRIIGEHQDSEDYHLVLLSQSWDMETANETLWHELIHGKQAEDYSRQKGVALSEFTKVYTAAVGPRGNAYRGNPYEIEANVLADKYSKVLLLQ